MKPEIARDLKKLRWHLAALAAMVAIAAAIVWWSRGQELAARQERDQAASRFRQTENRLRQVRVEEQEIKDKSALFLHLSRTGVIGEERRLEWTELLRQLQQEFRIPQLAYEFAPQAPLEAGDASYVFFSSPMKAHLQIVHEGDLTAFLGAIQQRARALVVVRACTVGRLAAAEGSIARLTADCDLEWITARGVKRERPSP